MCGSGTMVGRRHGRGGGDAASDGLDGGRRTKRGGRAARRVAVRLPDRLQPAARRYGLVARLGAYGLISQSLHGPADPYREIVGVRQHDGWLYLLSGSAVDAPVYPDRTVDQLAQRIPGPHRRGA
jgi:hypothetical protein